MAEEKFKLKLRGRTCVFVDWANVYGWKKSLKAEVNPRKLYRFLKSYKEVKFIGLYHGTDRNDKSKQFLKAMRRLGYEVTTKPVKYIRVAEIKGDKIYRRKCDFDMEIALDCFENLDKFDSYIFMSGDGDFATLYERLIQKEKQVIVIYAAGHIGREIWEIKRGIFKINVRNLGL